MTNDVTIKQKVHQKNPTALFVRDIIAKNKKRFNIKLPIVIDFVDQLAYVGEITKPDGKYYYIPISKRYTSNAISPLGTKTKNDDYIIEYDIMNELSYKFNDAFPRDGIKISDMRKYAINILQTKMRGDVIVIPLDKNLKLSTEELKYIMSRIKYFKNKMGIKKKIILNMYDTTQRMGVACVAYTHTDYGVIFLTLDYNLYMKNKGRLVGNKGFDLLLLHELAHTKIPDSKAGHGVEFKKCFNKYASDITKNKDVLKSWGSARMGANIMPHTVEEANKNALAGYMYDVYHVIMSVSGGSSGIIYNKSKSDMMKDIKDYNKVDNQVVVYINAPIPEKYMFDSKIKDINELGILSGDKLNILMDYFAYKLYEKYGDKKYLKQLRSTARYKQVMRDYKPILKRVEDKLKKNKGKTTARKRVNNRVLVKHLQIKNL